MQPTFLACQFGGEHTVTRLTGFIGRSGSQTDHLAIAGFSSKHFKSHYVLLCVIALVAFRRKELAEKRNGYEVEI